MAYSNGSEAREAPAAFANARITVEEAERLSAIFRPSWEIDLPSAVPATTEDERPREKAHVANADVRSAIPALNGTHAPAPSSILRDAPMVAGTNGLRVDAPRAHLPAIDAVAPYPRAPKPAALPLDLEVAIRRPKLGLWIAIGGAGAIVAGALVFWLASGSEKPSAAPPSSAKVESTNAPADIPPPPPLENLAPEPTQAAPPPTVAAPRPAPAPAPVPAPTTPPSPPPVVVHAALPPPAPRPAPNVAVAQPAPKAPHAKSSAATIVRDVPF